MCGCRGLRGIIRVGVGTKRLVRMGQLILSMGPVWREACILAQRATTPNKGFFLVLSPHICRLSVTYAVDMLLVPFIFFSSAGYK
jgi:hypothetical protein